MCVCVCVCSPMHVSIMNANDTAVYMKLTLVMWIEFL